MSVRDGLLAILSIGPAYGHQLHTELRIRAAHRGPVNVGQIYTTIERLTRQKLIEQRGSTDDRLPLYRLTAAGRTAATTWMTVPAGVPSPDWTEMLDQLLITSTVDIASARSLAAGFEEEWQREVAAGREASALGASAAESREPGSTLEAGPSRAAAAARAGFASAALSWLAVFVVGLDESAAFGLAESKPLRGRRPGPKAPPSPGAPLDSET